MWCSGFFYVHGTRAFAADSKVPVWDSISPQADSILHLSDSTRFPARFLHTKKTRSGDFILLRVLLFFFRQKFRCSFELFQKFARFQAYPCLFFVNRPHNALQQRL